MAAIVQKKRGATWKFAAIIADDTGIPISDFTGWQIWMTIKKQESDIDDDAVAQVSLEDDGITVIDSETGEVEARFEADVTTLLPIRKYVADLKVKSNDSIAEYDYSATITIDCVVNITGAT